MTKLLSENGLHNNHPFENKEVNNSLEIFEFLSAIKAKDGERLKKIRFAGYEYSFSLKGLEYKLKNLTGESVEICKFVSDEKNITVPAEINKRKVVGIGAKACYGKKQLTSLSLSDNIRYIKSGAFANCSNLKNVNLKNSKLITIGEANETTNQSPIFFENNYLGVFENCAIENIDLPETLEKIGENTFRGCSNLKEIRLPDKIKIIENYCFYGCNSLEKILFSSKLREIGNGAFYGCKSLKKINLPESVRKIKHFAFQQCNNLSELKLNDGLEEIGISTFRGCKMLENIKMPKTVSNIHRYSFDKDILIE